MSYRVEYTDKSVEDLKALDKTQARQVRKVIDRVSQNPLPKQEGGYGTALGNKRGNNLAGLCRIGITYATCVYYISEAYPRRRCPRGY